MEVCRNDDDLGFLLMRFNQRDTSAFATIYMDFLQNFMFMLIAYTVIHLNRQQMPYKRRFVICGKGMM